MLLRSSIAGLLVVLVAGPAAGQPTKPPTAPGADAPEPPGTPRGDPGEELEEATEPVEIEPAPIDDTIDTEIEAEAPKVELPRSSSGASPGEAAAPLEEEEIGDERLARRRYAHQVAIEETEPRPPLPPLEEVEPPPWARRIEIGGDFAFVIRPLSDGVVDTPTDYDPAPGWGIHLHWNIVDWFRITPYFLDSHHALNIEPGGLVDPTSTKSISPSASIETATVTTFSFGAKLQPTWNIDERLRTWATVGVGWGKLDFPVMTITEGDQVFEVRDRSAVFVEFPLGLGISYDVIDRWLAVEYEVTAAPVTAQSGNAHQTFQVTNEAGEIRDVGPFGAVELSVVQTLGMSLIF